MEERRRRRREGGEASRQSLTRVCVCEIGLEGRERERERERTVTNRVRRFNHRKRPPPPPPPPSSADNWTNLVSRGNARGGKGIGDVKEIQLKRHAHKLGNLFVLLLREKAFLFLQTVRRHSTRIGTSCVCFLSI